MTKTIAKATQPTPFTREVTLSNGTQVPTVQELRKPISLETFTQVSAQVRETVETFEREGTAFANSIMADQALMLANAVDLSDFVGPEGSGKPFVSRVALAAHLGMGPVKVNPDTGKAERKPSAGYISRLIRVARAIEWYGVRVGSADYTLLTDGQYGASSTQAFADTIGKARTEMPSKAEREAFKAALVEAHGLKVAGKAKAVQARKAQPDDGSKGKDETPTPETKPDTPVTAGDLKVEIHKVETKAHDLPVEGQRQVAEDLMRASRALTKRLDTLERQVEGTVVETRSE